MAFLDFFDRFSVENYLLVLTIYMYITELQDSGLPSCEVALVELRRYIYQMILPPGDQRYVTEYGRHKFSHYQRMQTDGVIQ